MRISPRAETTIDTAQGRHHSRAWGSGGRLANGGLYLFLIMLPVTALWPVTLAPLPGPSTGDTAATLYIAPTGVGVAALIAGGLLSRRTLQLAAARFLAPLVALVALGLLTAPLALMPQLALYAALHWAIGVGVYLVLTQSEVPPERALAVLLASMAAQALLGVGQLLLGRPLGLPGEQPFGVGHPLAPLVTAGDSVWLRAYGLTTNPNVLGGFLAVAILLALPLLRRPWARGAWWLLWVGLIATFSRSAWLALLLTAPPAMAWLAHRQPEQRAALRSAAIGLGGILLLGALLLATPLRARLQPLDSPVERGSLSSRGYSAQLALGAIAARPFVGVGAANFPLLVGADNQEDIRSYAHNVVLQVAAEIGVLGGAIWLWIWLTPALWLWRRRHQLTPWATAAGTAWLAMGVINLFDAYFWVLDAGRLMSMLVLALLSQAMSIVDDDQPSQAEGAQQ